MAQTTRRSRSQPQGFRRCALRALHQPFVSRCETFCINGSMCCQALSDKHGANHSYAFVPVEGRKGQLHSKVNFQKNQTLGFAFICWLCCVFPFSDTDSDRGGQEEEDLFWNAAKFLSGEKKTPPDLVSLFGVLRHGKSARTVCVVVFYGC